MNRFSTFMIFLVCGLSIFAMPALIAYPFKIVYMLAVTVVFLISYFWARTNEELNDYVQILLAFFISSLVFMLQIYWSSGTTVEAIVVNKIISTLIVVIPIVLLVKFTTNDMSELYLQRGNLRRGIIVGAITLVLFIVTAIPVSIFLFGGQEVTVNRLFNLSPWIVVFILANGLKEELLFRGLFLKKYESFQSPDIANLLQAVIFSLAHLSTPIDTFVIIYLVLTFFLGLAFGGVMQDTDSLLGSVLFHAAADIPVILAIFSYL
ncbi:MAG: type II CAAX endopeptidase family protein [Candidatus Thorarchaeota archaeon]